MLIHSGEFHLQVSVGTARQTRKVEEICIFWLLILEK